MYDPCVRCPRILRKAMCRKFCTIYKAAVRHDVHNGMIELTRALHNRIVRAQK
jgi:hypothetical protein